MNINRDIIIYGGPRYDINADVDFGLKRGKNQNH